MDRDGERRFSLWSAAHASALHKFAYLLCGDWHEAEDVVQEVLAKAALHWRRIERVDYPEAYVRTMVVNELRSMWRRPWRRARPTDQPDVSVGDATDTVAARTDLVAALRQLPLRQRATVVLRYFEDLSEEQTAAALGCSVGTVKSQSHKAIRSLQRTMTKEGLQC